MECTAANGERAKKVEEEAGIVYISTRSADVAGNGPYPLGKWGGGERETSRIRNSKFESAVLSASSRESGRMLREARRRAWGSGGVVREARERRLRRVVAARLQGLKSEPDIGPLS